MSFSISWKNIEARTIAFHSGAGDKRSVEELLISISKLVTEAKACWYDGNPESKTIPPYTSVEERMGAVLTDLMLLCAIGEFDIPEAMIRRNTEIRTKWRLAQAPKNTSGTSEPKS